MTEILSPPARPSKRPTKKSKVIVPQLPEPPPYQEVWDGVPLSGEVISLDTETEAIGERGPKPPRIALASASDGQRHVLVWPGQVDDFLIAHAERTLCFWNVAFDFHVLHEAAGAFGQSFLWLAVEQGRVVDLMLADQLIRLADGKGWDGGWARGLAVAAADYLGMEIPKDEETNPYRLTFATILGKQPAEVEQGYKDYAILDAVATRGIYDVVLPKLRALADTLPAVVLPNARKEYGLLTHDLQVKAAVALGQVSRNGMGVNPAPAEELDDELRSQAAALEDQLEARAPGVLARYTTKYKRPDLVEQFTEEDDEGGRRGKKKLTKQSQVARMSYGVLLPVLERVAADLSIRPPLTPKTQRVTTAVDVWREIAAEHPFVRTWVDLVDADKLIQFTTKLRGRERVYPQYRTLVSTGRTSCREPNIQQIPRDGRFRSLFIAPPGCKLVACDYSAIELRTLAAVCRRQFGWSRLAEVLERGVDPHTYTAAMVLGMDPDEFAALKTTEPAAYKLNRQRAKVINFGTPGGLGGPKLAAYAKANYGVDLSVADAIELRRRLVEEVYPELRLYLASAGTEEQDRNGSFVRDEMRILAGNLGVSVAYLWDALKDSTRPPWFPRWVRKVVVGQPYTESGRPLPGSFCKAVWSVLGQHCSHLDSDLRALIVYRGEHPAVESALRLRGYLTEGESFDIEKLRQKLAVMLFSGSVATLTGRLRAGVGFTEARNTPFQGLAADGAKAALWELVRKGYRVVAFVHDEIVVEAADSQAEEVAVEVRRVMCEEMSKAVGGLVPIDAEYQIADCWTKP